MERIQNGRLIPLISVVVLALSIPLIVLPRDPAIAQTKAPASVKKSFKRLKVRIAQLEQRVESLSKERGPEGPSGPAGPQGAAGPQGPPGPATGPAGGDLTGTYPNPLIGRDAVGSAEITDDAVGGHQLRHVSKVVSPVGTTISAGQSDTAVAQCPIGAVMLTGGWAWEDDEPNYMVSSAPSDVQPRTTWFARGHVTSGTNRLYAWATCLDE